VTVDIVSVAWDDPRAVAVRAQMDLEMSARYDLPADGEPHRALHIDPASMVAVGLASVGDEVVGHAALRDRPDLGALELKRVMVLEAGRRRGIATALLAWVDDRAREIGTTRLVLHTGSRQPEAIALYEKLGWQAVPVFPPYDQLPLSCCYAREL
jgi:GNAT superfamily N-acetyltransferase